MFMDLPQNVEHEPQEKTRDVPLVFYHRKCVSGITGLNPALHQKISILSGIEPAALLQGTGRVLHHCKAGFGVHVEYGGNSLKGPPD